MVDNVFLVTPFVILGYMSLGYIAAMAIKRGDLADVMWGLGFVLVAWVSFFARGQDLRAIIVNSLVTIWGLRLLIHIWKRFKSKKSEDFRYEQWRQKWKFYALRSYLQIFILQGIFMYMIAITIMQSNQQFLPNFTLWDLAGLLIWCIGFFFESTGDRQLRNFIANPDNKGKLMNQGLWKYTRHPNYFGEVTMWWGLYLIANPTWTNWWLIISPLTITILILFISGIPLLEKKYQNDKEFQKYKKRTSIFFPLPPKKI